MSREMSNEELIAKAVITTDSLASAGKLNPKQSDTFIDYVVDLTGMAQYARVVRFRNESLEIDKIGVGTRVTMPASEARDPGVRRGINTSKVTLTPKEQITPFEIGDSFMENNIEGTDVEDHIVRMMATAMGNDTEDLFINGDSLGPAATEADMIDGGQSDEYVKDNYMAQFDGWLRQADAGHTVDLQASGVSSRVFSKLLNALPAKYKRNKRNLVYLCSQELEQLYRERVSSRATASGDRALSSDDPLTPFGIPLIGLPLFQFYVPVVEHITFTGSGTTKSLRYAPIQQGSVVVTVSTLANVPMAAYEETTDYTVDYTAGTITHAGGGSGIGTSATVKVTYRAMPQILLTHNQNMIIGIGRDVRIERDRDIYKRVNQFALTTKVDVKFENTDAIVKGYNIADDI